MIIENSGRAIIIGDDQPYYAHDIRLHFDEYYNTVIHRGNMLDLSHRQDLRIRGFDMFPVDTPSFPDNVKSINKYIEYLKPQGGDIILDLGAYTGLSSIMLDMAVEPMGTVYSIEADPINAQSQRMNLDKYQYMRKRSIPHLYAAVWDTCGEVVLSAEGNMGSSACNVVRGIKKRVPCYTLSGLCNKLGIDRVDCIKCDIEGAEGKIFTDDVFFEKNSPRIFVELHKVGRECKDILAGRGYEVQHIPRSGVDNDAIYCHKNNNKEKVVL